MEGEEHLLPSSSALGSTTPHPFALLTTLKRPASPSFAGLGENACRKRVKEDSDETGEYHGIDKAAAMPKNTESSLVEELVQELQCGCCSDLVYRPVVVSPCQHFFCGSCCLLWIRNGGTNCPTCRSPSTAVSPSRPFEAILAALLRAAPEKTRATGERAQADEIYKAGTTLRLPTPREASPEPNVNQNTDYAHPCPHCVSGNTFGWRCPQPIADPNTDPEHAWHLDDGTPPGHSFCGNCENMLAILAPSTTKCDLCQIHFCGISVQGRCTASLIPSQQPHGMSDVGDLIQSAEVYDCFDNNTVEVEIMFDYLTTQRLTPKHIYREIVTHIQSKPQGFKPLIELDLFVDIHGIAAGIDPNPDAPRTRICRMCATEVLLWGLKDWWIRERQKGFLDEDIMNRKDCAEGTGCARQKDLSHAKEYNHMIAPRSEPAPELGPAPEHNTRNVASSDLDHRSLPPEIDELEQDLEFPENEDAPSLPIDATSTQPTGLPSIDDILIQERTTRPPEPSTL